MKAKTKARPRGTAKTKKPSVWDRALLLAALKDVALKQRTWMMAKNNSLLEAHDEMGELAEVLEDDRRVVETTIGYKDIESASILTLCETLQATKVSGIDKPRICQQIRAYLKSEEPCACPPVVEDPAQSQVLVPCTVPFEGSFRDPYGGARLAVRYLEHCSAGWCRRGMQFAPSCAILQSSGSGKSRLLVEIAKTMPTFYVCSREADDLVGYPRRSPRIADHLSFGGRSVAEEHAYARCAAFFCVASVYARAVWQAVERSATTESAMTV